MSWWGWNYVGCHDHSFPRPSCASSGISSKKSLFSRVFPHIVECGLVQRSRSHRKPSKNHILTIHFLTRKADLMMLCLPTIKVISCLRSVFSLRQRCPRLVAFGELDQDKRLLDNRSAAEAVQCEALKCPCSINRAMAFLSVDERAEKYTVRLRFGNEGSVRPDMVSRQEFPCEQSCFVI